MLSFGRHDAVVSVSRRIPGYNLDTAPGAIANGDVMNEPEDLTLRMLREIRREQDVARQDSRSTNELIVLLTREVQRLGLKIDRSIAELRDELELAIKVETTGRAAYSETRVETRLGEEIEELRRRIDEMESRATPRV